VEKRSRPFRRRSFGVGRPVINGSHGLTRIEERPESPVSSDGAEEGRSLMSIERIDLSRARRQVSDVLITVLCKAGGICSR